MQGMVVSDVMHRQVLAHHLQHGALCECVLNGRETAHSEALRDTSRLTPCMPHGERAAHSLATWHSMLRHFYANETPKGKGHFCCVHAEGPTMSCLVGSPEETSGACCWLARTGCIAVTTPGSDKGR